MGLREASAQYFEAMVKADDTVTSRQLRQLSEYSLSQSILLNRVLLALYWNLLILIALCALILWRVW
jgi:hypothetical protein